LLFSAASQNRSGYNFGRPPAFVNFAVFRHIPKPLGLQLRKPFRVCKFCRFPPHPKTARVTTSEALPRLQILPFSATSQNRSGAPSIAHFAMGGKVDPPPAHKPLPLPLPLQVPAIILNAVKDPEEITR
jgi:hypothetical protein